MVKLLRASIKWCLSCAQSSTVLSATAAMLLQGSVLATTPGNVVKDTYFVNAQKTGSFTTYSRGQKFGDWHVSFGNVDLKTPYFTPPTEGTNLVDLNGTTAGGIRQVLETVPGKTYTLRFKVSGNWESTSANRVFRVTAGPLNKSLSIARPTGW